MAKKFGDFNIDTSSTAFLGKRIEIDDVFNKIIMVHKFRIVDSKYPKERAVNKCLHLQISIDGTYHVVFTISNALIDQIQQVPYPSGFPFETKITNDNRRFQFN